jgi:hypothetical protein
LLNDAWEVGGNGDKTLDPNRELTLVTITLNERRIIVIKRDFPSKIAISCCGRRRLSDLEILFSLELTRVLKSEHTTVDKGK